MKKFSFSTEWIVNLECQLEAESLEEAKQKLSNIRRNQPLIEDLICDHSLDYLKDNTLHCLKLSHVYDNITENKESYIFQEEEFKKLIRNNDD